MGDECSEFIYQEYVVEYQELHKAICLNLNGMIWNIAFLKKAKEAQERGVCCRNDSVIGRLYKNEFELLVLRLNRTFFDKGPNVITLSHLKERLFSKYLLPAHENSLRELLRDIKWKSNEIVAARRRLEGAVPILRKNYIAHTLMGVADDVSVSYLDCEKVVMAACDFFNRLGFGLDSFYYGEEKACLDFIKEQTASENFLEEFFIFQQTSAWCIKKLDFEYSSDEKIEIVKDSMKKINLLFSDFMGI